MATVSQVLSEKGPQVMTVSPSATVLDAALLMNEHRIGAVVVQEDGRVVGIFTERDILRRVVAERLRPGEVSVGEVMTHEVICCRPEASLNDARTVFMQRRIRHLPVCDEQGELHGVISIGDINAYQLQGQTQTIHYLHEYLYGNI